MCFYHKNPHHSSACRGHWWESKAAWCMGLNSFPFLLSQVCCGKFHPRIFPLLWVSDRKQLPFQFHKHSTECPRGSEGEWARWKREGASVKLPETAASESSASPPQCQLLSCSWEIPLCNQKLFVRKDFSIMKSLLTTTEVMDQTLHHFLLCCWSSFYLSHTLPCLFPLS